MLILNYHFDRFLYFDAREDRIRCDTTIVAEFEGERITFHCEFYSIGKHTEWRTGTIFFKGTKQPSEYVRRLRDELNKKHSIMDYIVANHKFMLSTYVRAPKIHIEKIDIIRRRNINSKKAHWRVKFLFPAAHHYVTAWIKHGHPYIRFQKELDWNSSIWYPGWREDLANIFKLASPELNEWN
ncbi:hypothetical protein [Bacillus bombysepticus]|uniref:hypothetical protein n=1 Tax=Bacillus bombysepticus TaxID=658666 RepID=UPI00301597B2